MKYITLKIALILLLFSGCDRNVTETPVQIIISNNTGEKIEMKVYESVSQSLIKTISIESGNSVSKVFIEKESESPVGPKDFFEGDSLSIVFGDNQRILNYQCQYFTQSESCAVDGNILNLSDSKWQLENGGESFSRSYTFTTVDFENATPCEGDCE